MSTSYIPVDKQRVAYSLQEFQALGGPCRTRIYELEREGKLKFVNRGRERGNYILHSEAERYFAVQLKERVSGPVRDMSRATQASLKARGARA